MWEKYEKFWNWKILKITFDKFADIPGKYKGYLYKILRKIDRIEIEMILRGGDSGW